MKIRKPTDQEEAAFLETVDINTQDIHEEFVRIAGIQAYWTAQFAEYEDQYAKCKRDHEEATAQAYLNIREDCANRGVKTTEDFLKASVTSDPDVKYARELLIDSETIMKKAKAKAEAFRTKRDALISYGAIVRAEMGGDTSLRNEMRVSRKASSNYDD